MLPPGVAFSDQGRRLILQLFNPLILHGQSLNLGLTIFNCHKAYSILRCNRPATMICPKPKQRELLEFALPRPRRSTLTCQVATMIAMINGNTL